MRFVLDRCCSVIRIVNSSRAMFASPLKDLPGYEQLILKRRDENDFENLELTNHKYHQPVPSCTASFLDLTSSP